jgi:dolichol-phosphate mannosyltransferase
VGTVVCIPTYNEAEVLPAIVAAVRDAVPQAHLLIVDDASPDGTGAIADRLATRDSRVAVLHRTAREGLGAAYRHAFQVAIQAGYLQIVQMGADFSHAPADVPRLLAALRDGADLAVGSRYTPGGGTSGWGAGRRWISSFGCRYAAAVLNSPVNDLTAGFKAWRAPMLQRVLRHEGATRGYAFQIEMTWRAATLGARVVEVPICFEERRAGVSKMSVGIAMEAAVAVWRLRLGGVG